MIKSVIFYQSIRLIALNWSVFAGTKPFLVLSND
jgi:hypothetical protein